MISILSFNGPGIVSVIFAVQINKTCEERARRFFFFNYKNRENTLRLLGWYDRNCVPVGVIKHEAMFAVYQRSKKHVH